MSITVEEARKRKSLSHKTLENLVTPAKDMKLSLGHNLYLLVKVNGSKLWRMKYKRPQDGKEDTLSFGTFPQVTQLEAIQKRDEARLSLNQGIDPKVSSFKALQSLETFREIAEDWYAATITNKLSYGHKKRTRRLLDKDLYPTLADIKINKITSDHIYESLKPIMARGAIDTAHRARSLAETIFIFAINIGKCTSNPPALTKRRIPKVSKTHYPAITNPKDFGRLIHDIDHYHGSIVVQKALQFLYLSLLRPGEVRKLKWTWVNDSKNRIEIPASVMKTGNDHIVPLSKQMWAILTTMQSLRGNSIYIFPSLRGETRTLSENTFNHVLRSLNYDKNMHCSHGFRASARTIMDEELNIQVKLIEHQLAHAVKDTNGRAYNRTQFLDGRAKMLQTWADYLDTFKESDDVDNSVGTNNNVIAFRRS